MAGTATFVRQLDGFTGDARLYRCDPPLQLTDWDGTPTGETAHVVASATAAMFSGPETYLFPADESGAVTDWGELPGSFRGGLDHERALADAGYAVASTEARA